METQRENLETFDYSEENMIHDLVNKINFSCIYNKNRIIDLMDQALEQPDGVVKTYEYSYLGSLILTYIYDKNKIAEINDIIRLNIDDKLKINYSIGANLEDNTKDNIKDYVLNSLWAKLRAYKFESIINSHDFDIHIYHKDPVNNFNFSDAEKANTLAKIQVLLEKIGTNITKELNKEFKHVSININNTYVGIHLLDPSILPSTVVPHDVLDPRDPRAPPRAPVAPVASVDPLAPVAPVATAAPFIATQVNQAPVDPLAPVDPVAPVEPLRPQDGGYVNMLSILDKFGYELITKNNKVYNYTYVNPTYGRSQYEDEPVQRRALIPPMIRIYYTIKKKNDPTNTVIKIFIFDICWDRKDLENKRVNDADYFHKFHTEYHGKYFNIIKFNNQAGYGSRNTIKNVISLYDSINNYFQLIKDIKYMKRKKAVLRLLFYLNLLFNKSSQDQENNGIFINYSFLKHLLEIPATGDNIDGRRYLDKINELMGRIINFITALPRDGPLYKLFKSLYYEFNIDNLYNVTSIHLGPTPDLKLLNIRTNILSIDNINNYNTSRAADTQNKYKQHMEKLKLMFNLQGLDPDDYRGSVETKNRALLNNPMNNNTINHFDFAENNHYREVIRKYTSNSSQPINSYIFSISLLDRNNLVTNIDTLLNDPNAKLALQLLKCGILMQTPILPINEYPKDYLIVNSGKKFLHSGTEAQSINNMNIGETLTLPYFVSTTIIGTPLAGFNNFPLGYTLYIVVPMNEKFINVTDNNRYKLSSVPAENEIILLPGKYTVLSSYNDPLSHDYGYCFLLYESVKINFSIVTPDVNELDTPAILKNYIIEYYDNINGNDILEISDNTEAKALKNYDFDNKISIYNQNFDGISMNKFITKDIAIQDKYLLTNISPYHNIFKIESEQIIIGTKTLHALNINFKTILYSGRTEQQLLLNEKNHFFMSQLYLACDYGIAHNYFRNLYTIQLDGTANNIILLDILHPENITKIVDYYNELTTSPNDKTVMQTYYKIQKDTGISNKNGYTNPVFKLNNDIIRIKYRTKWFSSMRDDYSKYSQSTENDAKMMRIFLQIFGPHDGYICSSIFSLSHSGAVFDDEISIYDISTLHADGRARVIDNIPTTIHSNITLQPGATFSPDKLFIASSLIIIKKVLKKFKLNKLIDTMRTLYLFDKHIPYQHNYFEKIFRSIYDFMQNKTINYDTYITNTPPAPLVANGGSNNYYKKYLKYKQKYIELKNMTK
jgi:hypothetical protein